MDESQASTGRPARADDQHRAQLLDQVMLEARRTGSLSTLHNRAAADLVSMNQTDWDCLDLLDWTGPIPAGELAKRVGLTSGAITGVLDRLEKFGLARRVADPGDRRRVIVEISADPEMPTDERFASLHALFALLGNEMLVASGEFDDDELAVVLRWLRIGNEAVERSTVRMRESR